MTEQIPAKRSKKATERMVVAAVVLLDARGRTLLVKPERGETNGLFSRMWQFPAKAVASGEWRAASKTKQQTQRTQRSTEETEEIQEGSLAALGMTEGFLAPLGMTRKWVALPEVRHTVTYREITLRPYLGRVESLPSAMTARKREERAGEDAGTIFDGARIAPLKNVAGLAVSSATRKIARLAEQAIRGS